MKSIRALSALTLLLALGAQAQNNTPVLPPGKLAVFKAGDGSTTWAISTARAQPCFVQVYDPALTNQAAPLVSVPLATNGTTGVWINAHAGSEGGGISLSANRQYLALEGYTGDIISPTNAKPSSDPTVLRGIVTLDAFTNATAIYSDLANWFGMPPGVTQNNPTGIASTDGVNFWGTGNAAGTTTETSGTLFYNGTYAPYNGLPIEIQNEIQAAAEARIINGVLYIVVPGGGVYNFVDPNNNNAVVPLPFDPNVPNPVEHIVKTNLLFSWGGTYKNVANFDMNRAGTIAYGADQTYGIIKFTNLAGIWTQAPYYFSTTNLGTTAQAKADQGCFGICVDFSGTNPVIYATTMEFGVTAVGNPNMNRLIQIVDNGNPGTNLVAVTLATAGTTNENFRGIDFTPDLRPLITSNPANVSTTNGGSATFTVTADSIFAVNYQWLQNGTNLSGVTASSVTLNDLAASFNGYTYQCVVSNQYGAVTSAPALLTVTFVANPPVITNAVAYVTNFVGNNETFAAITPAGTGPFTFQWYFGGVALTDGPKYTGSASDALSITNLDTTDIGNYYLVVSNSVGVASNLVDVLTVAYQLPVISAGNEPQNVITFVGLTASLTVLPVGGTQPLSYQWYAGTNALSDVNEFTGSQTGTLTISPASLADSSSYYAVVSNGGGSVTSSVATVTVTTPPSNSSVTYNGAVYLQNFNSLPDPGSNSVNSINNPLDPGSIDGQAYSLANPFDFTFPVITSGYVGGLGLPAMAGWYGAADTNYPGVDGITRFGAQDGDQTTGGVIDFGPNDSNGVTGTNRALGLLSTGTTGSTTFALKLVNGTSGPLNYATLSFTGELWHNGTGHRLMSFGYTVDPTATNFALSSESISNSTLVPGLAFSFPTAHVVTTVDGTNPTNQVSLATNNLALATPWPSGGALWLIWAIDFYGSGSGNGYAIDNLSFQASASPIVALPSLGIQLSGSNVILSWPVSATGFTLQSNSSVTQSSGWSAVGQSVVVSGGQNTVTIPVSGGAQYFRLTQ